MKSRHFNYKKMEPTLLSGVGSIINYPLTNYKLVPVHFSFERTFFRNA